MLRLLTRTVSELVERFARVSRDTPGRHLLHVPSGGVSLTARMIWQAHLEQREQLAAIGLGQEDLLLCAAGNRAAVVPLWLACRSLGIALMPVDAGTPPGEIATLARRFGARAAALSARAAGTMEVETTIPYTDDLCLAGIAGVEPRPELYRGAAALKLTSGSTGLPKATFTTESHLITDTEQITGAMGIGPRDCQLASIPLSHAYGIGNLLVPLLTQGTAFVLRDGFVPHQFASDALRFHVRVFPGVPFMFEHFIGYFPAGRWPSPVELLISAGARLDPQCVERFHDSFGRKIHSFYGTTETGGIAYDDAASLDGEPAVGRPIPGVQIAIRAEEGGPPGSGRVHVASGAVSAGYVGEPPDGDSFTDDGFLTGDYGRIDAHGRLVLTGRASSFINVAGRKVQPEEVEQVLRSMPGVADVRVLGAPDQTRGQQVVACIVAHGGDTSMLAVRRFCAARLAPYKIPRAIVMVDRIPLTERGKTDSSRLAAIVRSHLQQAGSAGVL